MGYGQPGGCQTEYCEPQMMMYSPMSMPSSESGYTAEAPMMQFDGCGSGGGCGESGYLTADASFPGSCGCSVHTPQTPPSSLRPPGVVPSQPRSFQPVPQDQIYAPEPPADGQGHKLPQPPAADPNTLPPQDLTPMDEPMEIPSSTPPNELFDPLNNGAAPAPDQPVDPVGFEVPRWSEIPEPGSRAGSIPARRPLMHVPTTADPFRR